MSHSAIRGIRYGLIFLSVIQLVAGAGAVFAQEAGRRGPQMDPKDRDAVWSLEVKSVAIDLGLDADKSAKLDAAYKVSRDRLQKAIEAIPSGDSGDFRGRFEARRKVRDAENEFFAKDLSAFLDEVQAKKAVEQLAAFSGRGDFSVKALSDIVTNPDTLLKSVHVLTTQLLKSNNEIASAMSSGGGTTEEWRERRRKMAEELNTELAKVLSEDEMKKWKESTDRMSGRNR